MTNIEKWVKHARFEELKEFLDGRVVCRKCPARHDCLWNLGGLTTEVCTDYFRQWALEEIEPNKPRWHDLRKDPNDLPKEWDRVLMETLRSETVVGYVSDDYWYIDYDDQFIFCGTGSPYVKAWREIEPFKE